MYWGYGGWAASSVAWNNSAAGCDSPVAWRRVKVRVRVAWRRVEVRVRRSYSKVSSYGQMEGLKVSH